MKYHLLIILLLFSYNLLCQQKGATPIPNTLITNTQSQTYAVVVGISDYQDDGIPDLRFADKDAEAFANFLRSKAGGNLDEDHLKVLLNQEATVAQFAMSLDWLWEVAKENDRIIIYFSGHGDVERRSITQPGYLLCWDAPSRVYMAGGAFNVRDLKDVISTISIQNKAKVILITDACRAGKLSGSGIGGTQATAVNLSQQYANEIKILSCQPDEYSIEGEQWGGGRGAFSYHLLDGLYGLADNNSDNQVNLKEIGRYLEDRVSEEVAPQNQNPMTIGSVTEKLTDVFPEILTQIKEAKKGSMQLFAATETRGIEDDVLAAIANGPDSNIVKTYHAFQKSLKDQVFLFPENACADFYFEKLIKKPQFKRLHSTMRRNYAAALQDDAQQVLNTMLRSGLTKQILKDAKASEIYKNYPAYLEKAATLLGEQHYMYPILQARKFFFKAYIQTEKKSKYLLYHQAIKWQPDMAHAMVELVKSMELEQIDSVNYYFKKTIDLVPSWVEPYIHMSQYYSRIKQPKKAEEMLQLAGEVDSTSVLVWYTKANFYKYVGNYKESEKWYLKTIEATGDDICFPCAHNNLGGLYKDQMRDFDKAKEQFLLAIKLDSLFPNAYLGLANVYRDSRQYKEAEINYKKGISLAPGYTLIYNNLGLLYHDMRRYEDAEEYYLKAMQIDSTYGDLYYNLGRVYANTQRNEKAKEYYLKSISLDSTFKFPYVALGLYYQNVKQYEEAEEYYLKAINIDPTYTIAYINLGIFYQKIQKWESSLKMMEKTIELGTSSGDIIALVGNALTHIPGRLEEAKEKLDKGLQLSPKWVDTYIYLAQWYLINNQPEQAWEYLGQALQKGFGNGDLSIKDLEEGPDFEEMRKDPKWRELMEKYFPKENDK